MNFGAGGEARHLVAFDVQYSDAEVVWQGEVYAFARGVADRVASQTICELGAGAGRKLITAFEDSPASLHQVDWEDRREKQAMPSVSTWPDFTGANLEDHGDLDRLEEILCSETGPILFIVADVIEHLLDPRPLLRMLRRQLRLNPVNRLVISSPDRQRVDGRHAVGHPDNPNHVRQWTLNEFGLALLSAGFRVERIGRAAGNQFDDSWSSIVSEVSCSDASYAAFLERHRLPKPSDHLVLTTEHASAERTGGIGTYHRNVQLCTGWERLILFAGAFGLPADWLGFVRSQSWLHVAYFNGMASADRDVVSVLDAEAILDAVLQAVFLYDQVVLIEYQDYLGVGVRIAQAKRAGLLPPSICVMAYAHGSQFYLDNAKGDISRERDPRIDARERLSLELADCVLFSSEFAERLYTVTQGLRLRHSMRQGYPVRITPSGLDRLTRGQVRTVIFYGKATAQKGYPDFCEAVLKLLTDPEHAVAAGQVTQVILMGVEHPDPRVVALPGIEVIHGTWSWEEAVALLNSKAPEALVVLPYRGDNHPLSLYEVVESDAQLLAYRAGGLPELVPIELHDDLLCEVGVDTLAAAMARAITRSFWERSELIRSTRRAVIADRDQVAADYIETYRRLKGGFRRPDAAAGQRELVSVIVPNFNGPRRYLTDLVEGLRNSSFGPAEVILVDDGSSADNFQVLEEAAQGLGSIPHRVIRNPTNLGLAGARNVGLAHVKTAYVYAHDNDNIMLNHSLDVACRILDANPDVTAATSWLVGFEDGQPWQRQDPSAYTYRPIGSDLGIGLQRNEFGDAMAVYRTDNLRQFGGWDASSRGLWEDWQLFVGLAARGHQIWVIPRAMFLYRIRPGSMARTYALFPGWLRVARALGGIPLADAHGIVRALQERSFVTPPAVVAVPAPRIESEAERSSLKVVLVDDGALAHKALVLQAERDMILRSKAWRVTEPIRSAVNRLRRSRLIRDYRLRRDLAQLGGSAEFDRAWYLANNPDVKESGMDPALHYLRFGAFEGRDPGPTFNTASYLARNFDVQVARLNPVLHYIRFGKTEGRSKGD